MPELLRALLGQQQRPLRFIVVGVWNTIFGYGVFVLLDALFSHLLSVRPLSYMVAMVVANVVAILNAFFFHRTFTFHSRVRGPAILGELLRFSSTYLFTFILSLILLPALVELFGLSARVAGAVILLICTVVSYIGHSRFTFRKTTH